METAALFDKAGQLFETLEVQRVTLRISVPVLPELNPWVDTEPIPDPLIVFPRRTFAFTCCQEFVIRYDEE